MHLLLGSCLDTRPVNEITASELAYHRLPSLTGLAYFEGF